MSMYFRLFIVCIYFAPHLAFAQNTTPAWDVLNQEVLTLRKSGEYGHAIITSKMAILVARAPSQATSQAEYLNELRTSLSHLASIYKAQGNYSETIPIYQEMLSIWKKIAGPKILDKVTMKDLADAYRAQGRYLEAEALYLKALEAVIDEMKVQFSGSFYDSLALSIFEGLSAIYWVTERISEAEEMDRSAAQIKSGKAAPPSMEGKEPAPKRKDICADKYSLSYDSKKCK